MNGLDSYSLTELRGELRAREKDSAGGEPRVALHARAARHELSNVSTAELIHATRLREKAIYVVDSRLEVCDLADASLRRSADSVCAIIPARNVLRDGQTVSLAGRSFGEVYKLCSTERFRGQPSAASCSGVLLAPDLVATAGHCIRPHAKPADLAGINFVFGYRVENAETESLATIGTADVYAAAELVAHGLEDGTSDYALVRLTRRVEDRPIARIRREGRIANDAALYIVGHPCGLPAKWAGDARVRGNSDDVIFTANLDAYGGNSGSPVFGADHVVEGLLVRGAPDFVKSGKCWVSLVIPILEPDVLAEAGEECTRALTFASKVPEPHSGTKPEL